MWTHHLGHSGSCGQAGCPWHCTAQGFKSYVSVELFSISMYVQPKLSGSWHCRLQHPGSIGKQTSPLKGARACLLHSSSVIISAPLLHWSVKAQPSNSPQRLCHSDSLSCAERPQHNFQKQTLLFPMFTNVCGCFACTYVYAPCVCLKPMESRGGCWIPQN